MPIFWGRIYPVEKKWIKTMAWAESPELGGNGSASGKTGAGRAGVTVVICCYWCSCRKICNRSDMYFLACIRKVCGLVKVAVIKGAVPGDTDQGPAHEAVDGSRVEAGGKSVHVMGQITALLQPAVETAKGDIGEGEEIGELDSPLPCQIRPEFLFCLALCNRHEGPGRVGDQIQFKAAARQSIADGIEMIEHCNAVLPDPFAALGVCLVGIGGGEGGGNGNSQLFAQVQKRGISVLEKENQVRAEDEFVNKRTEFL